MVTGQMFYFSTLACSEKKKKKKNSQGIRGGLQAILSRRQWVKVE